MGPKKPDGVMQNRLVWGSKMLFIFVLFWVASKTAQEGPKGAQDAPGSPPEGLKRAQEVPKSTPGGSKRASRDPKSRSRGSKPAQELPIASQDAREAFPKHLARQPCSDNSKNSNLGAKKHRRGFRSPTSMNSKRLASNRRKKKGGRAAVIPLGEVNKVID